MRSLSWTCLLPIAANAIAPGALGQSGALGRRAAPAVGLHVDRKRGTRIARLFKAVVPASLLLAPAVAQAHAFWLQPERFWFGEPQAVSVAFRVGDGVDIEPWNLRWDNIGSLRSCHQDGCVDQQAGITVKSADNEGGATVSLMSSGTHVLAFESRTSFNDLESARFNAYAEEEGLDAVIAERERSGTTAENGTETYTRRAKAFVQAGGEPTDNVLQPIGQTLEIVPERHPYAMGNDRRLPVRVLFRGQPLANGLVELVDLQSPDEPVARQRTDAEGRTIFVVPARGDWRIGIVWSVPEPNSDRADFDTIFSSLTFGYPAD